MRTANYSDFRKKPRQYINAARKRGAEPVVISNDRGLRVALVPIYSDRGLADIESLTETDYITSSPAMMAAIREAEKQAADGEVVTFRSHDDMEAFFRQIEAEVKAELAAEAAEAADKVNGNVQS